MQWSVLGQSVAGEEVQRREREGCCGKEEGCLGAELKECVFNIQLTNTIQ